MAAPENPHQARHEEATTRVNADDVLEGGFVSPLQDYFVEKKHRADTARRLPCHYFLISDN